MGIDATFPFGADEQKAHDVPAGEACGPTVAEHGHEFFKVADVPGWQEYNFPELQNTSPSHLQSEAKSSECKKRRAMPVVIGRSAAFLNGKAAYCVLASVYLS
jgi:hypothetical protein